MRACSSFIVNALKWLQSCIKPLQWRHNGRDGVLNHQPHDCLFSHLFRRRSKKISKPRVAGLCAGNSPVTGEFPAQMASNAENVSFWWRHHALKCTYVHKYCIKWIRLIDHSQRVCISWIRWKHSDVKTLNRFLLNIRRQNEELNYKVHLPLTGQSFGPGHSDFTITYPAFLQYPGCCKQAWCYQESENR